MVGDLGHTFSLLRCAPNVTKSPRFSVPWYTRMYLEGCECKAYCWLQACIGTHVSCPNGPCSSLNARAIKGALDAQLTTCKIINAGGRVRPDA